MPALLSLPPPSTAATSADHGDASSWNLRARASTTASDEPAAPPAAAALQPSPGGRGTVIGTSAFSRIAIALSKLHARATGALPAAAATAVLPDDAAAAVAGSPPPPGPVTTPQHATGGGQLHHPLQHHASVGVLSRERTRPHLFDVVSMATISAADRVAASVRRAVSASDSSSTAFDDAGGSGGIDDAGGGASVDFKSLSTPLQPPSERSAGGGTSGSGGGGHVRPARGFSGGEVDVDEEDLDSLRKTVSMRSAGASRRPHADSDDFVDPKLLLQPQLQPHAAPPSRWQGAAAQGKLPSATSTPRGPAAASGGGGGSGRQSTSQAQQPPGSTATPTPLDIDDDSNAATGQPVVDADTPLEAATATTLDAFLSTTAVALPLPTVKQAGASVAGTSDKSPRSARAPAVSAFSARQAAVDSAAAATSAAGMSWVPATPPAPPSAPATLDAAFHTPSVMGLDVGGGADIAVDPVVGDGVYSPQDSLAHNVGALSELDLTISGDVPMTTMDAFTTGLEAPSMAAAVATITAAEAGVAEPPRQQPAALYRGSDGSGSGAHAVVLETFPGHLLSPIDCDGGRDNAFVVGNDAAMPRPQPAPSPMLFAHAVPTGLDGGENTGTPSMAPAAASGRHDDGITSDDARLRSAVAVPNGAAASTLSQVPAGSTAGVAFDVDFATLPMSASALPPPLPAAVPRTLAGVVAASSGTAAAPSGGDA